MSCPSQPAAGPRAAQDPDSTPAARPELAREGGGAGSPGRAMPVTKQVRSGESQRMASAASMIVPERLIAWGAIINRRPRPGSPPIPACRSPPADGMDADLVPGVQRPCRACWRRRCLRLDEPPSPAGPRRRRPPARLLAGAREDRVLASGVAHRRGAEQGTYLLLNPALLAHQDVPAALQHDCPHPRDPAS